MRFRFAVLVAVTSLLTVVSPAHAGRSAATDWAFVSRMTFAVPLATFSAEQPSVVQSNHGSPVSSGPSRQSW